ncbi:MAG: DNA repair protein RecN [Gammaproteobacteria bacterium]|jgi:DNA repair protein RecN (Recombination protein N)|nr:DNA repair protein RecN [Gammaproteobacteria bacterium]
MLQQLSIQNYATVDNLEIEFKAGMSVITGETGAGKSVILGALGLALGDRADKTVLRGGSNKADICAQFDASGIRVAQHWLTDNDLESNDDSGTCILRRVVNGEGRSKGYINGSPVTMANLKTLGEMLIDIHSQHEHQSLLQRSTHQRLLDDSGVDKKQLDQLHSSQKQWQQNFQKIQELSRQSEEYSAQSQLLAYQLSELDELAISDNEATNLETEFKSLNHADEIISSVQTALDLCNERDDQNVTTLMNQTIAVLKDFSEKNEQLNNIIQLMETVEIQLNEAVSDLHAFHESFDANPLRLEQVNARLSELHAIARKHRVKPEQLSEVIASLRQQLNRIQNSDEELEQLQANDALLRSQYLKIATDVSVQRKTVAIKLASQVNTQLHQLGMPDARLEVCLQANSSEHPSENGLEIVEFLICTNPGQAPGPLRKIASGGELSRISLAIQVITAKASQTPSLVFDEVDVGIGGGIAKVVGELLRELGERTQILCVTHQAQVAGQGHHHFLVNKHSSSNSTVTRIDALKAEDIVREVARMLGGEEYSDESLAHAEQMVASN